MNYGNLQFCADRVIPEKTDILTILLHNYYLGTIIGDSNMKRIRLTQNKFALVDDEDYQKLIQHRWYSQKFNNNLWYAGRKTPRPAHIALLMHREILGLSFGDNKQIDHKDGDGLNNQRYNLRICTQSQNNLNRPKVKGISKYKGVYWDTKRKLWYVQVNHKYVGVYEDETIAAKSYDKQATKIWGEFAWLNFPKSTKIQQPPRIIHDFELLPKSCQFRQLPEGIK